MNAFSQPVLRRLMSAQLAGPVASACRVGLRLLAEPYSCVVRLRNRLYDAGIYRTFRARVPVISVGNITVGGTGKTPVVEYLASRLSRAGRRIAVLSRGYRGRRVSATAAATVNDEHMILARHLPESVVQLAGPDRAALARQAVEENHCDVLILDDGFQHRRLGRDLNIVLIDALEPFGYGHVLPRGLLREPLGGLRRADLIAITRTDLVESDELSRIESELAQLAPAIPVIHVAFKPQYLESVGKQPVETEKIEHLSGKKVFCFCGIGNPAAFAATLEHIGIRQVGWHLFRDHHHYTGRDAEMLNALAVRSGADALLTTEKDAVKLQAQWTWQRPVLSVRVSAVVTRDEDILEELLERALAADESEGKGA